MPNNSDLVRRFSYHPADTAQRQRAHSDVRAHLLYAAQRVDELMPEGREKALAFTKLEEAMMWANAGIAREGR